MFSPLADHLGTYFHCFDFSSKGQVYRRAQVKVRVYSVVNTVRALYRQGPARAVERTNPIGSPRIRTFVEAIDRKVEVVTARVRDMRDVDLRVGIPVANITGIVEVRAITDSWCPHRPTVAPVVH